MGSKVTRMSARTRTLVRVGGIVSTSIGVLFLARFMSSFGSPVGPGGGPSAGSFFVGPLFLMLGLVLLRFGFMGAVSEVVATETQGAVRVAGRAVGEGMRDAGFSGTSGGTQPVVKVRCRACGSLDDEDARYCSGCGKPLA